MDKSILCGFFGPPCISVGVCPDQWVNFGKTANWILMPFWVVSEVSRSIVLFSYGVEIVDVSVCLSVTRHCTYQIKWLHVGLLNYFWHTGTLNLS